MNVAQASSALMVGIELLAAGALLVGPNREAGLEKVCGPLGDGPDGIRTRVAGFLPKLPGGLCLIQTGPPAQ